MLTRRPAILLMALLAIAATALVVAGCSTGARGNAPLAPQFSLTERSGRTVTSADLKGKAYLVNFIFTSCHDACPTMTMQMANVQQALQDARLMGTKVMLVSISFDPEHDTPAVLTRYAASYQADPDAWLFLTGTPEQTRQVVEQGFGVFYEKASMGESMPGMGGVDFTHANVFILVDGQGRIRQTYTGTSLDMQKVLADIREAAG